MSELTDRGRVETHADGSRTFIHGHRYPDNHQVITQEYNAAGQLVSARVMMSGFAGKVLDVTVTFGPDGQPLKEEGYRAPDMTTPVSALLKPLPAETTPPNPAHNASPAQEDQKVGEQKKDADTAPVAVPSLAPAASPATMPATPPTSPVSASPGSGAPSSTASSSTASSSDAPGSNAASPVVPPAPATVSAPAAVPAAAASAAPPAPQASESLSDGLHKIYGDLPRTDE